MQRAAYREQDHAFGRIMLTLRSAMGLTQAELATMLGISRRSVVDWEAGNKRPKAEHLRLFIGLAHHHSAFPIGREADKIRALWNAAHPKAPLDETWLTAILVESTREDENNVSLPTPSLSQEHWVDWGDARHVELLRT